jgi:Asp/Glu/hydantoin racemase
MWSGGVGASPLSFAAGEEGLAERMIEEARLAIEGDGAQAIIGYGGLNVIRALREALPVPVISPVAAGILFAEMLSGQNYLRAKL